MLNFNKCFIKVYIQPIYQHFRHYCSELISDKLTETEKKLTDILSKRFKNADNIQVRDISGGCGAMFSINVVSSEFKNISIVRQHQMITEILKDEIKNMHGLRIFTSSELNDDK